MIINFILLITSHFVKENLCRLFLLPIFIVGSIAFQMQISLKGISVNYTFCKAPAIYI